LTVVFSNGFRKMHLTTAAREANQRGLLSLAITGAYPTAKVRHFAELLRISDRGRVERLMERDEALPADRLHPLFLPELLDEAARLLVRAPLIGRSYPFANVANSRLYARLAGRKLRLAADASIYHFRASFGGASIDRARDLGMVVLCDHALAHPSLLEELVVNRGGLRDGVVGEPSAVRRPVPRDPLSRAALSDIEQSDAVLVNSEFVKDTFVTAGYPAERIHVAYLGVDDNFLAGMPLPRRDTPEGPLRIVFASRFERRKGAEALIEALTRIGRLIDWELVVAGPVTPEIQKAHGNFLMDPRVTVTGPLSRPDFKRQMLSNPVFVFPSYAEGSARAVFEALACGCYVITTPNAGSIVESGVHGRLVPPGDAEALATAIAEADADRLLVSSIGNRNAELVRKRYRQSDWGDALAGIYRTLSARQG
jgi:glycosyltransferase involved in cell wall biosynthesis